MREYDLVVIGSGPAGQKAAIQAGKLGRSVLVIEKMDVVGGVAINTGTIPSKALREAVLEMIGRRAVGASARLDSATQLQGLVASCQRVIQAEVALVRDQMLRNHVELATGTGSFVDDHTIAISGPHDTQQVHAKNVLIAVGTHPARPDSVPFDRHNLITSDELLHLPHLPHSMIVVGGGVIGTEYASMLSELGVKVTLVEGRSRVLEFIDAEVGEALQYHLRQKGMTLRLGENVVSIDLIDPPKYAKSGNERMVEATLESGKVLRADGLLYCIGRQGATAALNLDAAGLSADKRGRIEVNEHFQTAREHIYACGDVIGFPALASTSMEQGRVAACHMFDKPATATAELFPFGIYAIPEISMVGWTEEQLTKENIPYECGIAQYKEIARGQLLGDEIGMLKLLIHQETHHILGVHVIGTGATELIHIGQAVMAFRGTVEYFVRTVFNYPTLAECYKVAALNGINKLQSV